MQPRNNKTTSDRRNKQFDRLNGEMDNRCLSQMLKKLYLNNDTADVFFVFKSNGDDESERVPAHKLLLTACSDGFKHLFATAEDGQTEFKLDDVTADAFKEYMQFFYMSKVKLTFENFAVVLRLAKDFGNEDFMTTCGQFLDNKLTVENIIWGLSLAIRFDRAVLKRNCEQRIIESTRDVLKSNSFYECDRDVLKYILQLNTLNCHESQLLTGCLSWAKKSAEQKNLDKNDMQVIRAELGDLLYDIRFKSMTMPSFTLIIGTYGGLFTGPELEELIQMITLENYKSPKFNSKLRLYFETENADNNEVNGTARGGGVPVVTTTKKRSESDDRNKNEILHCNRIIGKSSTRYNIPKVERTLFQANNPLMFHSFNCGPIVNVDGSDAKTLIPTSIVISEEKNNESNVLVTCDTTLTSDDDAHVKFCCPIRIEPNHIYAIKLELSGDVAHAKVYNQTELKKFTELKNGTKVRFLQDSEKLYDTTRNGLIQRLVFKRV